MTDFRTIKELASIVERNKIKNIQLLDSSNLDTKLGALYSGLANNIFETDEVAAEALYQATPNHRAYTKLKSRLSERLINSLFFLDINQPNFKEIQKAYYTCYKNVAAEKILLGRGARGVAIEIAEKTLKKAIHFDFTELVLTLVRDLRGHYGNIVGNRKKFQEYNQKVKKYNRLLFEEIKAEEYYYDLGIDFVNFHSTNTQIRTKAQEYHDELREVTKTQESYRLKLLSFLVFALKHQIHNDHEGTLKVCEEALNYFETKKHLASAAVSNTFQGKLVETYIQLGKLEEAEKLLQGVLPEKSSGSSTWYNSLNHYIILLFHAKNFGKAFQIYQKATNHPKFNQQKKATKENWRIYEAYIYYFIALNKIIPVEKTTIKKFKVSKFLNEVPTFSKDKQGTNITIIILQILFLLQQRKYSEIIDRMEPLKIYNHRYLRKDETFRSSCFIKMLLQLPQANFHRIAVDRKANKYLKRLEKVPFHETNQNIELEPVPYEMLWEFVLESLDEKFH